MNCWNDYRRIREIGKGAFGAAILVECKCDKSKKVIKVIKHNEMNERQRLDAKKEIELLSKMKHQNIVKYYSSFEENGSFHIVMELCDGGDLHSKIKSQRDLFREEVVLNYFVQICLAVKYIHDQKILHRDIKPQNIFLMKNDIVKLGDFGIAKLMNSTTALAKSFVGTPFYLSPEICEGRPYNNKSDIWALGCVLYEICALRNAFNANEMHILTMKIRKLSYNPLPSTYSIALRSLVDSIFKRIPSTRPDINGILCKPLLTKISNKYDYRPPSPYLPTKPTVPKPPSAGCGTPVVKKPVGKRPSTADVKSRVDSGLGGAKRYRPQMNNNPRFGAVRVERKPSEEKQKYDEYIKNIRLNLMKKDSDEAWKNVIKSNLSEESNNNKPSTPEIRPIIAPPMPHGHYDHYHEQLRKLEEQIADRKKEMETLDKMINLNDDEPNPIPLRNIRHNPEDPVILNPINRGYDPHHDRVLNDFLERKYQAMLNKRNDGNGVGALFGGYQKAVPNSPRKQEYELAERLQQIRKDNIDRKKFNNIDKFMQGAEYDPSKLHDTKVLKDLQLAARQKVEELQLKLAKHREAHQQKQNELPDNKIQVKPNIDKKPDIPTPKSPPENVTAILNRLNTPQEPPPKKESPVEPLNIKSPLENVSVILSRLNTPREPTPKKEEHSFQPPKLVPDPTDLISHPRSSKETSLQQLEQNQIEKNDSDCSSTFSIPSSVQNSSRPSTASSQQQSKKSILNKLNAKMKDSKDVNKSPNILENIKPNGDQISSQIRREWKENDDDSIIILQSSDTLNSTMNTIQDITEIQLDKQEPINKKIEINNNTITVSDKKEPINKNNQIILDKKEPINSSNDFSNRKHWNLSNDKLVDTSIICKQNICTDTIIKTDGDDDKEKNVEVYALTNEIDEISTDLSITTTISVIEKENNILSPVIEQTSEDLSKQIKVNVTDPILLGKVKIDAWTEQLQNKDDKVKEINTSTNQKEEKTNSSESEDSTKLSETTDIKTEENKTLKKDDVPNSSDEKWAIKVEIKPKDEETKYLNQKCMELSSKHDSNVNDDNEDDADDENEDLEKLNEKYIELLIKREQENSFDNFDDDENETITSRSNEDISYYPNFYNEKSEKPISIRRVASEANIIEQYRRRKISSSSSHDNQENGQDGEDDNNKSPIINDYFEDEESDKSNLLMANIEEIREKLEKEIDMDTLLEIIEWIGSNKITDDLTGGDEDNIELEEKESAWIESLNDKLNGRADLVNEIIKLVILEKQLNCQES